jgi:Fe/S biogenesis protein NfuA
MDQPVLGFDEGAARKLREMRDAGRFQGSALRISADEEGASFRYQIEVVKQDATAVGDAVLDCEGIPFYVDPASASRLRGATLQYVDSLSGGGFRFENPNRPRLLDNPLAVRVQEVLDEHVNPSVAAHGGRVALVDVQGDRVFVRFGGGCQGCGMASVTLKDGVVATLTSRIPEISEVVDATDHAAGETPYY